MVGTLVAIVAATLSIHRNSPDQQARWKAELIPAYTGRYSAAGPYVGPSGAPTVEHTRIAADGLPVVNYPEQGDQVNPLVIAFYGLAAYGHHDERTVTRAANWLVAHQTRAGLWLYRFSFGAEKPPWGSAIAQGVAMSLLERAYRLTGRETYRQTAIRAIAPLEHAPIRRGAFLEEYPSAHDHVLNGFMFAQIGLHDLASVAPHSLAPEFYREGRAELLRILPRYDVNGVPSYDLTGHMDPAYVPVDVFLLRALNSIQPSRIMRFYADRWAAAI